eukprot:gb/GECH01000534.1/.p1 GENE.gb/GECH01000534.1/~~gb/GECH01000534.1/.p1  ORF type:complete len:437 (+),score=111.86 gb/GECH01000534.1/:1-1311(+)
MLELKVIPGKSVGLFQIGMPLSNAITHLRRNSKEIKKVEVIYNENDPLNYGPVLTLLDSGIILRFEPHSQRLISIEVSDLRQVKLSYSGTVFTGTPSRVPTFVQVYQLFGPTYPGKFQQSSRTYHLHYSGVTFLFPIPSKYEREYAASSDSDEIPMELPDGTTPVARSMRVFYGKDPDHLQLPSIPKESIYLEPITARIQDGLFFSRQNSMIKFGDTPQDVITSIGAPSKVFVKDRNKIRIHAKEEGEPVGSDYFYNYFHFGIDVMFDGTEHVAKKFILHTNIPGTKDFNRYVRCNYKIPVSDFFTEVNENNTEDNIQSSFIHPSMSWNTCTELLGKAEGQPLINNYKSTNNPFGGTRFYAYRGCIFEVMKCNYMSSVTLFQPSKSFVVNGDSRNSKPIKQEDDNQDGSNDNDNNDKNNKTKSSKKKKKTQGKSKN